MNNHDQALGSAIVAAGANIAPRITPDDIEANIASERYFTAADGARYNWLTEDHADFNVREIVQSIADSIPSLSHASTSASIDSNADVPAPLSLLTFCVLTLRNGFTVTGESACASPENFSADIGRRIARENAVAKIYPLMGYELRSKLAQGVNMKNGQRQLGAATATLRACPGVPDRLRGSTRELCNVRVPAEARQRGEASALLRQLCAEADGANVMLILFVEPFDGGPDADVLAKWYARHGFAEIQTEPVRMMARMIGATPRALGAAGVPSAPMEARQ